MFKPSICSTKFSKRMSEEGFELPINTPDISLFLKLSRKVLGNSANVNKTGQHSCLNEFAGLTPSV